jgi:hypothetical protein
MAAKISGNGIGFNVIARLYYHLPYYIVVLFYSIPISNVELLSNRDI